MQDPKSVILTVTTYEEFHRFVRAFGAGKIPLLLIIGEPGTSKSQSLRRALKANICWIEGQASAISMYCMLYRHRNELIVIDDVDSIYADDAARRLLKSVCQTDHEKTVSWNTRNRHLDDEQIPRTFTTTSKICIITNEWKTLSRNVAAIEDRSAAILFQPTALEVHREVATWFDDQECFDFLGGIAHLIEAPSMRHYIFAQNMRLAGFKNWKQLTLQRVTHPQVVAMYAIKSDQTLKTEKQRVKQWIKLKHGSRATYFRVAKRLPPPVELPKLKVKGPLKQKAQPKPPKPRKSVSKSHVLRKAEAKGLRIVGDAS